MFGGVKDAEFERKWTFVFKNDMKNFSSLKNSDFILESKMTDVSQNKNAKQPGRSYAV